MERDGDDDEVSIISDTTRNSDTKLSPFKCEDLHLDRLSRSKEKEGMEQADMNFSPVYPEIPLKRLKIITENQNKDTNVSQDVTDDSSSSVSVSLLHSTYQQQAQSTDLYHDASSNSEKLLNTSSSNINQTGEISPENGNSSSSHNTMLNCSNLSDEELIAATDCPLSTEEKRKREEELFRQIQTKQDMLFDKTDVSSEEDFLELKHQLQLLQPLLKHLCKQQRSERTRLAVDIKTSRKTKPEKCTHKQRLEELGKKQKILTHLIKRQNELKSILKAASNVLQKDDVIEDEFVPKLSTLKTFGKEMQISDVNDMEVSSKCPDGRNGKCYVGIINNDNEVTRQHSANRQVVIPLEQRSMKTDEADHVLLNPMVEKEEKRSNKSDCNVITPKVPVSLKPNVTQIQKPQKTNDDNPRKRISSMGPCIISEKSDLLNLKERQLIKLQTSHSDVRCASVSSKKHILHGTISPHLEMLKSPPPSDTDKKSDNISPGTTTCSDVFPVKSKEICRRFQQRKLLMASQSSSQSQSILLPATSHGCQFGHEEGQDCFGKTNIDTRSEKFGGLKFPPLSMLVNMDILRPGDGVLSISHMNKTFVGSLSQDGMIIAVGGEMFRTPLQWCRAVIQNVQMKKSEAYRKIHYKGKSLINHLSDEVGPGFYENCKNEGFLDFSSKETLTQQSEEVIPSAPFMHRCTVRIISESNYASCEDLPHNFWSQDFASVKLGHHFSQEISLWN